MEMLGLDNKKLKEKGTTLLEALVATAIVGIGFIAVFQMVNFSLQSIDVSSERTKIGYLSDMVAEDLLAYKNSTKSGISMNVPSIIRRTPIAKKTVLLLFIFCPEVI